MPPRPKPSPKPHRVYQPGKRHFELIASVSRSSGLEKDGDALRDFKTQQEYRSFIQDKLNEYWRRFPYARHVLDTKVRDEVQGNILIQFRKLREGIMSTKRNDEFALEVYETSLYLAVLFSSPVQATSIISQLLPDMYRPHRDRQCRNQPIAVLSCLHFLCTAYPSQNRFLEHLTSLPNDIISKSSDARRWLWALARALRQRNFAQLDQLTSRDAFSSFVASASIQSAPSLNTSGAPENLELEAIATLVDTLRIKARDTAWSVLRSAYRELSCPKIDANQGAPESSTRVWLHRSLLLRPVILCVDDLDSLSLVDRWLAAKETDGSIQPREGLEGRWLISKLK